MKTIKKFGITMALLTGLFTVAGLQSKTNAPAEQLIFIYNADSGIFNAVSDYVHKIVSPATYPCSLCGITYSNLGMEKAWAEYLKSLAMPTLFLHKDQLENHPGLQNLALPAAVLGLYGLAGIARIVRSSMLDVLSQEYIKTARIKGLNEFLVLTRHALRNALVPAVTVIGLTYGGLLEGSVLTETIFSWPGLGRYLATAFLTLDLNAVVGGTMLVALTFSLANLAVDLVYAFLNPKITLAQP